MTPPKLNSKRVIYYDIQHAWKKLKPFFESPKATDIWKRNMADFYNLRKEELVKAGHTRKRSEWKLRLDSPSQMDSSDWRYDGRRRGPHPAYWDYVCYRACHWVADLGLYVATYALPKIGDWMIVTNSKNHSTVWNGSEKCPILFDINFSAIGISPSEAWTLASTNGELYPPKVMLHSHLFHSDFTRWFKKVTKRGYI